MSFAFAHLCALFAQLMALSFLLPTTAQCDYELTTARKGTWRRARVPRGTALHCAQPRQRAVPTRRSRHVLACLLRTSCTLCRPGDLAKHTQMVKLTDVQLARARLLGSLFVCSTCIFTTFPCCPSPAPSLLRRLAQLVSVHRHDCWRDAVGRDVRPVRLRRAAAQPQSTRCTCSWSRSTKLLHCPSTPVCRVRTLL